jgi:HSP20 family protein
MTAIRWWNPSLDLLQTARTMDRFFDQLLGYGGATSPEANGGGSGSGSGVPTYYLPVDIMETDEAYLLTASVPGFAPEQVEVTFQEGMLTIQANAQPTETKGRWVRQERPWGSFVRRLELPQQILGDQISAAFDNGVLTVTVPKLAKPEPVKIPIGGGQKQLKS